jgi:hypothetical protein
VTRRGVDVRQESRPGNFMGSATFAVRIDPAAKMT